MKKTTTLSLDKIDKQILRSVQADGRISISDLAQQLNLSASACARRLRLLEEAGVIRSYGARIDPVKVGIPMMALVRVSLSRKSDEALATFEAAMARAPEVMEAYLMTGRDDYVLRVVVADLPAFERFLKQRLTRLVSVSQIESSFMLKEVSCRCALPIED